MKGKEFYKIGEFSQLLNVSIKTLQRWDHSGVLKSYRTPTGKRYYTHKQYLDFKSRYYGERFEFCTNYSDIKSICGIRINSKEKYIVLTELDSNTGISVTNGLRHLIPQVCTQYNLNVEDYLWYEEYERHDICSLVTFSKDITNNIIKDIQWVCVDKSTYGDKTHRLHSAIPC